jgi:hypothetical protein
MPPDLGNTLLGRQSSDYVVLYWTPPPLQDGYRLYRSETKGQWLDPPTAYTNSTALRKEVTPPPYLYHYRVAAVSCTGVEGP